METITTFWLDLAKSIIQRHEIRLAGPHSGPRCEATRAKHRARPWRWRLNEAAVAA